MHHGDLGNARRREPRLVRERPPAFHEHFALVKQVRAAGFHQIDERQLVLLRDLLRAERLLQAHRRDRAALDRAIAREDQRALARDHAYARDAAAAHDARLAVVVVHAPSGQRREFEKGRAVIKKPRYTLARQDLAALGKFFGLLGRMGDHRPFERTELLDLREELSGIGLEGFGLR